MRPRHPRKVEKLRKARKAGLIPPQPCAHCGFFNPRRMCMHLEPDATQLWLCRKCLNRFHAETYRRAHKHQRRREAIERLRATTELRRQRKASRKILHSTQKPELPGAITH